MWLRIVNATDRLRVKEATCRAPNELTREVILPVSPEEAWDALTTEAELEAWFADEVELDPRPGGEATFRWEGRGSRRAVVEEVSEPHRFAFRWDEEPDGATRSEGGPGTLGRLHAARPPARHAAGGRRVRLARRGAAGRAAGASLDGGRRLAMEQVDAVFAALADPTRRQVIERLAAEPTATATQLATELPITRQAVAKHLGALTSARLATAERHGRETHYRLTPEPLADAVSWMPDVGMRWDERLDALAKRVSAS